MAKKLDLNEIVVQSFITEMDSKKAVGGFQPGETLDEEPCTFDTMPRDCA